ncbi:hypothetical protein [Thermogymnomonas acidicola]|uniref:hypothetical protein n=1 Tax=Thermogymnomonas acidicola TaxID=399579 RepID=UPI0009467D4F|nr:hypothetical protein [Thermogymnomonas acidicola]
MSARVKYVALSDEGAIELSAEAAFPVSRRDGYFMVSLPASPSNVRAVNTSRTVRLEWGGGRLLRPEWR